MPDEKKKSPLKAQWKKGQSGNPAGRPKRRRDDVIDDFFEEVLSPTSEAPYERRWALLQRLYTSAMNSQRKDHPKLLEICVGLYWGKPRERVELTGAGGGAIKSEDVTPGRRPTTGELRKRMEALLAKREAHLRAKAAANSNGDPKDPDKDPDKDPEPEGGGETS